jgi:hypothetical protein
LPVSVSCLIVGGKENFEQERFVLFCAKCTGKNPPLTPKKTPKKVFKSCEFAQGLAELISVLAIRGLMGVHENSLWREEN